MRNNILAVILGGGQGARLFPLTEKRSKPAVPFGGKYRIVDLTISNCINSDISKIFVLTQFNSASLNHHISQTYRFSLFADGFVEILAAEQTPHNKDWFQGSADAVRQVMMHIESLSPEYLLILSGDHLYQMDYRKLLRQHDRTKADVTVSVIPIAERHASGFGLLRTDAHHRIVEFREKPPDEERPRMRVETTQFGLSREEAERKPYLASMGVYVFTLEALRRLLENTPYVDFGHEVIPAAIEQCNVQAFLFNEYWEDIGTISSYYQASLELTSLMPRFNLFSAELPIYTRADFLPGSKMTDCVIRDSLITEGCILNRTNLTRSIIGLRSRIGSGTQIENSILMGADSYQTIDELEAERQRGTPWIGIGEDVIIRQAIVDKNVRIGSGVRILNEPRHLHADGDGYHIRDGIVIIPKGATIPDGTII